MYASSLLHYVLKQNFTGEYDKKILLKLTLTGYFYIVSFYYKFSEMFKYANNS